MTARQDSGTGAASSYDTTVLADTPAQYYRLDESSGTVAADDSGNNAPASYVGSSTSDYNLAQSPGPIASETAGWLQALGTSASHGVLAPGVATATNTSSWTAEAWVKLPALPRNFATIFGSSWQNRLLISSAGSLLYQNRTGKSLTSATLLQPNTLYHIVLRSDLTQGSYGVVSLFINGVKDPNTLAYASASNRQGMTSAYYWGQYDTTIWYKFAGYIGRVAYYSTALSDARVAAHYAAAGLTSGAQASPTPVPVPSNSPAPVITAPPGISAFAGQIYGIGAGKISIDPRPYCGYMNVATNSSTVVFNGPVAKTWAIFTTAGGSCSTSSTATTVTMYSAQPTSATASGTVNAPTSYGFTLSTSSGAIVPILLTSTTAIFGGTLTAGANVTVTGLGSASETIAATQVAVAAATPDPNISPTPTPGPITTQHVLTAGFIYGYSGTPTTVPLSSIASWISWAETDSTHAALLRGAGMKVVAYNAWWRNYTLDNPNYSYVDLAPGGAHASAEAKDCSGNPVVDPSYGTGYVADPRTTGALGHAQLILNYRLNQFGSNYDAMFSDQTATVQSVSQPPCNYDQSTYDAAVNAVHSSLGVKIMVNALGSFTDPSAAVDLTNPSNVIGAMCELCYGRNGSTGDSVETGTLWQNVENAEILMMSRHKLFWDYARLSGDPTAEIGLRTYAYASFLLTYDPNYAMFNEALQTSSGFPVMPEVGLVPLQPVTNASTISGYQAPGGAYFREFALCYYRGSFVARCAIAVNPSPTTTVPIPSTSYFHSMALSGSGVLDGGTVSFTGPQVSQLAPSSAAILFP